VLVAQVALSVVIVVSAGLFLVTFAKLARKPLGFDAERVLVIQADLSRTAQSPAQREIVYRDLVRTIAALPGVAAVGGSLATPLSGRLSTRMVRWPEVGARDADRIVAVNFVEPGWFAAYGTPVRSGRDVTVRDSADAPPVAVVNDAFARKFFGGRNPVGEAVIAPSPTARAPFPQRAIVGLVSDAVYFSLREPVQPTMYLPLAQWDFTVPFGGATISVRTASGSAEALTRSIAAAVTAVNRDVAFDFRLLTGQVHASLTQERVVAMLSGFFGALALLLAGLGLYGVTTHAVARRRTEIGIRMALGATPAGVVRLVLSRVSLLVGLGIFLGAGLSLWASTFVEALLYGLAPRDPATLVGSAAILAGVGAIAGWLPAHRASRIDPAAVLRDA
jgi:predicted permease